MPQKTQVDLEFLAKGLDSIEARINRIAQKKINLGINTPSFSGAGRSSSGSQASVADGRAIAKSFLPLGKISGDLSEFTKSLNSATSRVIAFGASAGALFAVQKGFSEIIKSTIDVDKALTDINSILNLNSSSLANFSKGLFDVAKNTGQSFDAIAAGAGDVARLGLNAADSLERVSNAAILSRLSGLSLAESVNTITVALNSFDKAGLSASEVINKINNTANAFSISDKDLAEGIQRVGSSAQDAGISFENLLALLTSAKSITGRSGSVLGNSFKTIFTRLQRGKVQDALESVGVSTTDSNGAQKTQLQLLTDLAKVYDTLTPRIKANIAEQVGGVFQINVLKATLGDLGKEYGIYQAALEKASQTSSAAQQRNEALNKSFSAQFNVLAQNVKQFSSGLGIDLFGPSLKNILGAGNSIFDALNKGFADKAKGKSLSIGEQIGTGIISGIGSVLSGPGLVTIGVVLTALGAKLGKDVAKILGSVLGVNGGAGFSKGAANIQSGGLSNSAIKQQNFERLKGKQFNLSELESQRQGLLGNLNSTIDQDEANRNARLARANQLKYQRQLILNSGGFARGQQGTPDQAKILSRLTGQIISIETAANQTNPAIAKLAGSLKQVESEISKTASEISTLSTSLRVTGTAAKGSFLDRTKGFLGRNGGKISGIAGGLGIGAGLLGGAIGGAGGSLLSAGGNIASLGALGATLGSVVPGIGTAIGAVVGGATGLIISLGDVADAFSSTKSAADKAADSSSKFSTDVASPIQDITSQLLQNQSNIKGLAESGNPDDVKALEKAQDLQTSLLTQLNEKSKDLGATFDKNQISVSNFADLLEKVNDKQRQLTQESGIKSFLDKNSLSKVLTLRNQGTNTQRNEIKNLAVESFNSFSSELSKNKGLRDVFDKASTLGNQNTKISNLSLLFSPEFIRNLTQAGPKAVDDFYNVFAKQAQNLEKTLGQTDALTQQAIKNGITLAKAQKTAAAEFVRFNQAFLRVTESIQKTQSNIFGRKQRGLERQDAARSLGVSGLTGIQSLLGSLGQTTLQKKFGDRIANQNIENTATSALQNNIFDRNKGINDVLQNAVGKLLEKAAENAQVSQENGGDVAAQQADLAKLQTLSKDIAKSASKLGENASPGDIQKYLEDIRAAALSVGLGQKEVGKLIQGLNLNVSKGFLDSIQNAKTISQKKVEDTRTQQLQEAINKLTQTIEKQISLFGGFKGFQNPEVRQDLLKKVNEAGLARDAANKSFQTDSPQGRVQVGRTEANFRDAINNLFGNKIFNKNSENVTKGNAQDIADTFNQLIRSQIGNQNYQNFYSGTKGGASQAVLSGKNIENAVGGDPRFRGNPQALQDLKEIERAYRESVGGKNPTGAAETQQTEALTNASFAEIYNKGVAEIVKAITAQGGNNQTSAPSNNINVTVNGGGASEGQVKGWIDQAIQPVKDAIKSGNPTKINRPPQKNVGIPVLNNQGQTVQ